MEMELDELAFWVDAVAQYLKSSDTEVH